MADYTEGPEREVVTSARGSALASEWRAGLLSAEDKKVLKNIPPTLLASKEILSVVEKTGAVSPFFVGGGDRCRLKKATYEGRIGDRAFEFEYDSSNPSAVNLKQIFSRCEDTGLTVPKNGIVFVETDIDFRLPDFLALRFNLQIKHVHRGLLLGTGPLIDPGYWGKLCIPLHNLTDEDYFIPKDDGIIWIEFTKTTAPVDQRDPGKSALGEETFHGDIRVFLERANRRFPGEKIPIRSSLPSMFEKSTESAKRAEETVNRLTRWNYIGLIAAAISFGSLIFGASTFFLNLGKLNRELSTEFNSRAAAFERDNKNLQNRLDNISSCLKNKNTKKEECGQ